jgi:hypothetical protein
MKLPKSTHLPIEYLSSVFSHTTNSYKFYWFLSILENVNKGREKISIDDLIIN